MKLSLLLIVMLLSLPAIAQEILGSVIDSKHEPLIGVSVQVKQHGILKGDTLTDFDGNYSIKPPDTGYYDVTCSFSGFVTNTIMQIPVNAGKKIVINVKLENTSKTTPKTTQYIYKTPPINLYAAPKIITAEEINSRPTTQIIDMVDSVSHIHTRQSTTPTYIIDGVKPDTQHLSWRKRFKNRVLRTFHHNKIS